MKTRMLSWLIIQVLIACAFGQGTEQSKQPEKVLLQVKGDTIAIVRDDYGVPHVSATTLYGLFYGNGYAQAQDRLWQMEKNRRGAKGEAAEIFGASAVEQDKTARTDNYTDEERMMQFMRLPEDGQTILQAYADGVNAWIKEATEKKWLPEEYQKQNLTPREWSVTDTIAIGTTMSRRFGSAGGGELRNMAVLAYLRLRNKEKAELLFNEMAWQNDPKSPTSIPPDEDHHKPIKPNPKADLERLQAHAKTLPNVSFDVLMKAVRAASNEAQIQFARENNLLAYFGSYAVLVSPQKSASGNAILLGAPQMGFGTPHIAHEVHLLGAGINVIGMGFPGIPGVLIGHTQHLAWTTTSGIHDQVDIFIEKLNPQNPHEYWYKGQWVKFEKHTEEIKVKHGETVKLEVYRSVHGPIVSFDKTNNVAFAKQMSYWNQEMSTIQGILQFYRARTTEDFAKACEKIVGSHNFFCATKSGDIGFWYCGRVPSRASGLDPRLPAWGTGEYDWKGIMPFADMPHIINPKQGFIVNWNNKPAAWWSNVDSPVWGAIFRVERLTNLARAKPLLTVEDLKEMIKDIAAFDLNAVYLKPYLLEAARKNPKRLTPEMRQAVRFLEAWDHYGREGSVPKTIFDAWVDALKTKMFLDDYGDFMNRSLFNQAIQNSLVLYGLEGKGASVPRLYDFLNGKPRDEVVLDALSDAISTLTKSKGPDMIQWRFAAPRINFNPLGSVPYSNRGSYIQIVELNESEFYGESVLPPGQSEDPKSPHYSDQRDLASWWFFKPMLFKPDQVPK